MRPQLGSLLIEDGLLTPPQLQHALTAQSRAGGRLGDILVSEGLLRYPPLYRTLGKHFQLPYVDLLAHPPMHKLLHNADVMEYIAMRALPWRIEQNRLIVATSEPNDETKSWAEKKYGRRVHFVITSPYDIRRSIEHIFSLVLDKDSRQKLARILPECSAKETLTASQRNGLAALLALFAACCAAMPWDMLGGTLIFFHALYAATMLFKWLVFSTGTTRKPMTPALLSDKELPVYTLLIPLYREAESLPGLFQSLTLLDYPPAKLDVKLILESDDVDTYNAAKALHPPFHIDIIRVPYSEPRTKPKACNYALRFARGELITIYDAEDRPEPKQLRKAASLFSRCPSQIACLQSALNYYNADENLLTRWFSIEYAILFRCLLPGLEAMRIPIPLGGTSNHFRAAHLKSLGEWDPYNVTEDADLGVRLAVRGYTTRMLNSRTLEEAPVHTHAWLRQRSRWIKGYMQTWLVHMRDPLKLYRNTGWAGFFGIQFFLGAACLTFLSVVPVWILSAAIFASPLFTELMELPRWLMPLAWINLALYLILHWLQAWHVRHFVPIRNKWRFSVATFLFPAYWLLHSAASYKALWQLIKRPHFWEKTVHGVTRIHKTT